MPTPKPEIAIGNATTGEFIQRIMTTEEIAQDEINRAEAATRDAALNEEMTEKETKKTAILAALADATGYTPDELREALNA